MKSHLVSILGIAGFTYFIPESIAELSNLAVPVPTDATPEDAATLRAKGDARVLHSATQHLLQKSLKNVRAKAVELIGTEYGITPKLTIGKVEVTPVLYAKGDKDENGKAIDKEGVIKAYTDGKKTFKKDVKNLKKEGDETFFERFKTEKGFTDESPEVKALIQRAATEVPFSAEQKRVRGSNTSKPIGKAHVKRAEDIVKANNHVAAAERISKEIGKPVDVSDPTTRVLNLAFAMQEKARQTKAREEKELAELAGVSGDNTEENQQEDEAAPTIVDESKA